MPSVVPRVNTISSALAAWIILRSPDPGGFESGRGAAAERMNAPMHIGIVALVVLAQGLKDRAGFLRGRGVVKINQRLAVDLLVEDREVVADISPVGMGGPGVVD